MPLELLFLGTGTSAGIPMIGCECPVCRSTDPRDQRSRPSVMVSYPDAAHDASAPSASAAASAPAPPQRDDPHISPNDLAHLPADPSTGAFGGGAGRPRRFLIDTAPELRMQMVRHRVDRIDGVLYTHAHADHIFGIDDLRRFNIVMNAPIDIYAEAATLGTIRHTFFYIFEPHKNVNQSFVPTLLPRTIAAGVPFDLCGGRWTPLRVLHGRLPVLGYRVDYPAPGAASAPIAGAATDGQRRASLAYCTDLSAIPPETFPLLADLDVLVIDALRYRHHPTHLTIDQALGLIAQIQPRQAYLTHMAHDVSHADLAARLPPGVFLPYDGLCLRWDGRGNPPAGDERGA